MPSKSDIIAALRERIDAFKADTHAESVGTVLSVGDGVPRLSGLSSCQSMEMLEFSDGTIGMALNIEEESIGVVVLGETKNIKEGDSVKSTGRVLSIGVADNIIGRVVNPLGQALDGKGEIKADKFQAMEKI